MPTDEEVREIARQLGYEFREQQHGYKKLVSPRGRVILTPTDKELGTNRLRKELGLEVNQ